MFQMTAQNDFTGGSPQKFMTFALAGEEQGINIMKIIKP